MKPVRKPAAKNRPRSGLLALLTAREEEVFSLAALGYTNTEIALCLDITLKTVESHRKQVMSKLRLHSRAALVRVALEEGQLSTGPGGAFFKACPGCRVLWSSDEQFLSDREVRFVTYRAAPTPSRPGFLSFNHHRCGTSLTLPLESFGERIGEPLLSDSCAVTGQTEHCLGSHAGQTCPLKCVCAFAWRVSEIIRSRPDEKDKGFTRIVARPQPDNILKDDDESRERTTTDADGQHGLREQPGTT